MIRADGRKNQCIHIVAHTIVEGSSSVCLCLKPIKVLCAQRQPEHELPDRVGGGDVVYGGRTLPPGATDGVRSLVHGGACHAACFCAGGTSAGDPRPPQSRRYGHCDTTKLQIQHNLQYFLLDGVRSLVPGDPVMLPACVLLGRALETRARLKAAGDHNVKLCWKMNVKDTFLVLRLSSLGV